MTYTINPNIPLKLTDIKNLLASNAQLSLSEEATRRIQKGREYIDKKLAGNNQAIYGINTGFGSLCNTRVSDNELEQLQKNLVMSHACGTGDEVPGDIVRLMLLLKAYALSYGNSGVQLATVQRLLDFYNHNILPVVYQQGSLGASGDLAPLAHLSLPLLGLGEVYMQGEKCVAEKALKKHNWHPIVLQSKEGLALLNGTQFMSSYGVWCLLESYKLSDWADTTGSLSLEAFDGRIEPFHALIQQVRPHQGQVETARKIRELLHGSEIISQPKTQVQDPYSFRCIPQVHGASKDAIAYVASVFTIEINAVTDNPTSFPEEDLIISAGNFHGQPLAIALDFLAIALAELGNIAERRIYQLISGQRGLPPFLAANNPGLNSGFMIPQYTAAGIVSQNKQLCTPASVDSIVSSNGQEDHVSMGANAATKTYRVVQNLRTLLAIELMNAAQALEFRRPAKTSTTLEKLVSAYRKHIPFVKEDLVLHDLIMKSIDFTNKFELSNLKLTT